MNLQIALVVGALANVLENGIALLGRVVTGVVVLKERGHHAAENRILDREVLVQVLDLLRMNGLLGEAGQDFVAKIVREGGEVVSENSGVGVD